MRTCRLWGFLVDDGLYLCGICLDFMKTYLLFFQDQHLSTHHWLKENRTWLTQTVGQEESLRGTGWLASCMDGLVDVHKYLRWYFCISEIFSHTNQQQSPGWEFVQSTDSGYCLEPMNEDGFLAWPLIDLCPY